MPTNEGVIWRGFHHDWRYNHRLNRLGSYVQRTHDTAPGWKAVHTAASGTGPDVARFCDLYTAVESPSVAFEATQDEFELVGDESEPISETLTVSVARDGDLADREEYAVVLNGFDVVSEADADKLMSFSVSVQQPNVPASGPIEFDATVTFEADCGTPECSGAGVDYTCYVFFLVVAGDRDGFRSGPTTTGTADYSWDTTVEPDRKAAGVSRDSVPASDLWTAADVERAVGVTSLSVDLTKTGEPPTATAAVKIGDLLSDLEMEPHSDAMHLLELDAAVERVEPATTGSGDGDDLDVTYLTFYKNWADGMKQFLPEDFLQSSQTFMPSGTRSALEQSDQLTIHDFVDSSIWTHRNAGEATFDLTGRVLQFADPERVEQNAVPGTIAWPGEGRSAKPADEPPFDVRDDTSGDEPGDARHETHIS